MKENRLGTLNSKFKQAIVYIPSKYKDDLFEEFLKININNEKILAYILIGIDIALLALSIIQTKILKWDIHAFMGFSFYHVILLIVPIVFLYFTSVPIKVISENIKLKRILHIALTTTVIFVCSIISIYNIMDGRLPFAYTIAVLCIGSLILFEPIERFIAYGIPYLLFVISTVVFQNGIDIINRLEGMFFFSLLTIIGSTISYLTYQSQIKNYINNRMLNDMNKIVQESLEKRTEELNGIIEYEKLRTDFFANISHELRTPLTIISSAQQMLSHILIDGSGRHNLAETGQYMHMIGQNSNRLLRLISNLIDITKIDAGYFNVNLENYDIVKVVEDITLSIAKFIEDTDVRLIFDTEIEEKIVACDPEKIERIMLNLLSNAVKFTPKGGDIFVNVYERNDKIVISVKDTGIGVPPEMTEKIFERFVQVDKSTTRKNEGSGIGLSIVKSLVDMHGGKVYLMSEQGKGSEFIVELPNRTKGDTEIAKEYNLAVEGQNNQKIKIEFSDIYL